MNAITRLSCAALLAVPVTLAARPAATPTPLDNLKASIVRIIGATGAQWGIYMKSLETGEEIAINADRPMETASTIKLTLLTEVFEQIKAGKLKLTDKYTVTKADQVRRHRRHPVPRRRRHADDQGPRDAHGDRLRQHGHRRAVPGGGRPGGRGPADAADGIQPTRGRSGRSMATSPR